MGIVLKRRTLSSQHQYGLFKRRCGTAILRIGGNNPRNCGFASSGIAAVVDEAGIDAPVSDVAHGHKLLLVPFLSVDDIERFVVQVTERPSSDLVIAGGQGCLSVNAIRNLVDVVHFGRAEGIAASVIAGETGASTWNTGDPLMGMAIRQAHHLLPGERSVGCPGVCAFCQYGYTRLPTGDGYCYGLDLSTVEDSFSRLTVTTPGRYTTALDGWGEDTRRLVMKQCSDRCITDTLADIINRGMAKPVVIKIFQIVGYPWETAASVKRDVAHHADVLRAADEKSKGGGRVVILYTVTPFSPEPMTPMQDCPASIIDWRDVFDNLPVPRRVYKGKHVEAFILPQINGPFKLARRVAINRGITGDQLRAGAVAASLVSGRVGKAEAFLAATADWLSAGCRSMSPATYLLQPKPFPPAVGRLSAGWKGSLL